MKPKYAKFSNNLAFLDTLFNFVIGFAFLYLVSSMLVHPPKKEDSQSGVKLTAEFLVTMTWPDDNIDDIDMWMLLPNGKKAFFRNRDVEYVTLDRDDRGAFCDIITNAQGNRELIKSNKEMMTIRAIRSGKYAINAHVYATFKRVETFTPGTVLPFPVKITLTKLNPTVQEIVTVEFSLSKLGEQHTAFTFEIDENGNVININKDEDVEFVDEGHGSADGELDIPAPAAEGFWPAQQGGRI